MKPIKQYIMVGLGMLSLSACGDFLDIKPQNEIVLEDYWTEKADATSMLMSCYDALGAENCLRRIALWGEVRSDNMKAGTNAPFWLQDILKENLQPTNEICNWEDIYRTINYCNTFIHYAPSVSATDPNYKDSEMKANVAEAKAIRALCYFTLAKTFNAVPFTLEPSLSDDQEYILPATKFEDIVAALIADLEGCKDDAVRRFYLDDNAKSYENSSRFTRVGIRALLADLYLWAGDYQKCSETCDEIISYKKSQYEEWLADPDLRFRANREMALFNEIPLILESPVGSSVDTYRGDAYQSIFGDGNSFESLFELYCNTQFGNSNKYVQDYYCNRNNSGYFGFLAAPDHLYENIAIDKNVVFLSKNDCRAYENIKADGSRFAIRKYGRTSVSLNMKSISNESTVQAGEDIRSNDRSNWIFYRLTDVMLMKAEAELLQGEEHFETAFSLINAVNKRARNVTSTTERDTLEYADYATSQNAMEQLLFDERHRELMFEGKRWFDLVRMAKRDGNTSRLVNETMPKHTTNAASIRIKLADPNIVYYPYARAELKKNPKLVQNPAYKDDNAQLTN